MGNRFVPVYPLRNASDPLNWEFLPQGVKFLSFSLYPSLRGGEWAGEKNLDCTVTSQCNNAHMKKDI